MKNKSLLAIAAFGFAVTVLTANANTTCSRSCAVERSECVASGTSKSTCTAQYRQCLAMCGV